MRLGVVLWGIVVAFGGAASAFAQAPAIEAPAAMAPAVLPNHSEYTDLKIDQCTVVQSDDFGSTWACPGYRGIPVMVAEGDLRMMVSFGLKSTEERAAEQTLPPFNSLGGKIEWRMSNQSGGWKPFATILRYFTDRESGEEKGQVLVVTKLVPGATCHVAYVDALANPDANALAQKAADEKAPGFDCTKEPETVGVFKAW